MKLINQGNGEFVRDCGFVEDMIVDTEMPAPILLRNKRTGLEKGLVLGCIIPAINISFTRRSISVF